MSKAGKNYKLRQARELRGWTQKDVADQIELPDVRTFRRWESGEATPSLRYRARLCEIFAMDAEALGFATATQTQLHDEAVDDIQESPSTHEMVRTNRKSVLLKSRSTQQWNRQRFLARVHTFWIKEVLESSFSTRGRAELRLQKWQEGMVSPWADVIETPPEGWVDETVQEHSPSILQAYDDACGELLILGKTGAGKTTLLLELARELLARAMDNDAHPMPVVFQLAAWQDRRLSLADWMVEELNSKYYVPRRIGEQWVSDDVILPLLDGLEEVPASLRGACIEAINTYRVEHGLVPIVVCCHKDEYLRLRGALALSHAVCIQSMMPRQIDDYLEQSGASCAALQQALRRDRDLRQMITTPLALRTMMRAYEDGVYDLKQSVNDVVMDESRKQVCVPYVECMIERHKGRYPYSLQKSQHWLAHFAQQIKQGHRAEGRAQRDEYIQPQLQLHWLPSTRLQRLCLGLFLGMWAALVSGVLIGLISLSQGDAMTQALLVTPCIALLTGGLSGLIWAFSPLEQGRSPRKAIYGSMVGIVVGGVCMLMFGRLLFTEYLVWGAAIGLTITLFSLFLNLKDWSVARSIDRSQLQGRSGTWMPGVIVCVGIVGGCFGWFVAHLGAQIFFIEYCTLASFVIVHVGRRVISGVFEHTLSTLPARNVLFGLCLWLLLLVCCLPSLLLPIGLTPGALVCITLACMLATWLFVWFWHGGERCMQEGLLRFMLWMMGYIPWNYTHFLNCAVEQMLLSKSKHGYRFTNRLLLDYFASLEEARQGRDEETASMEHEQAGADERQNVFTA